MRIDLQKYKLLNYKKITYCVIFIAAILFRFPLFTQVGKDSQTFEKAVTRFSMGINPYIDTIKSFSDKDISSNGYAYFPGLLYTYYGLDVISVITHIPGSILWKIPGFLAEIAAGLMLIKILKNKPFGVTVVALLIWLFNPYLVVDYKYTYTDAIPTLLLFLSLYFIEKDSVLTGVFFALSVIFKPFPIFVFPIYLLLVKDKFKFLTAGFIIAFVFSLPFMTSISNFLTYIQGSLFVHEGREVTGRPFLFYISYYLHIEFFRIIPIKFYTLMATFLGWILILLAYFVKKVKDPYILATISLCAFYLFTPVLNRTYILWFLPEFLISLSLFKKSKFFYISAFVFYIFYIWYLYQWVDGFHITRPQ